MPNVFAVYEIATGALVSAASAADKVADAGTLAAKGLAVKEVAAAAKFKRWNAVARDFSADAERGPIRFERLWGLLTDDERANFLGMDVEGIANATAKKKARAFMSAVRSGVVDRDSQLVKDVLAFGVAGGFISQATSDAIMGD